MKTTWMILGLAVGVLSSGCVAVQPWERSQLSARVMSPDPDPQERKLDGHVHEYREASIGGSGVNGGGCGCN